MAKKLKSGETHASHKTPRTSSPGVLRVLQVLLDACASLVFYFSLKLETTHSPESRPLLSHSSGHEDDFCATCNNNIIITVSMSVNNNNISGDFTHTDDHVPSNYVIPGLKPFLIHGYACEYEQYYYFKVIILWVGNVQIIMSC